MVTEKQADEFFISLIKLQPVYVWGMNFEKLTQEKAIKLFQTYGSSTYTMEYYNDKLREAGYGTRFGADCSGVMYPLSQADNTAKGYYSTCVSKGDIKSIDLKHSCLVFRGNSTSAINHIGYYCASTGEVMEMESSKTNFQHRKFDTTRWKWWGKPKWIDYNQTSIPISQGWTDVLKPKAVAKTYPCKGVDLSGYNVINDYSKLKQAGCQTAILKIIRKDGSVDKLFEQHYSGLQKAGINIFAVYNYSYATNAAKAVQDAQNVIKTLNGRKIPVALDIEDKSQQGLGDKIVDIINSYQRTIEAAGLQFLCYTGMNFYNSFVKPYISKINCKNWWIARYYNGYTEMAFETTPNESKRPTMANIGWQYTSSGRIDGAAGLLDLNIIYSPITSTVVKKETVQIGTITTSSLRIRSIGSTQGKILGFYHKGERVELYEQVDGWYRTDKGWISGNYVQI